MQVANLASNHHPPLRYAACVTAHENLVRFTTGSGRSVKNSPKSVERRSHVLEKNMEFYCVKMRSSKPLPDEFCEMLYIAARKLAQKNRRELAIKSDAFEGVVRTSFMGVALASISGILFEASIGTAWGQVEVEYIVRSKQLEPEHYSNGPWRRGRLNSTPPNANLN